MLIIKKSTHLVKKKKIKMIEIAFLKSKIGKEEANSNAIIHGLEDMTW